MSGLSGERKAVVLLDRPARAFAALRLASAMLAMLGFIAVVALFVQETHLPTAHGLLNSVAIIAAIAVFVVAPSTWFAINAMRPVFLLPIVGLFAWINVSYDRYLRRAGVGYDLATIFDMLIALLPLIVILWAAVRGMLLTASERAMVRSLDRGAGYLTVLRTAFGVWPGLRRSAWQAVLSAALIYASQIIQGLSLVAAGGVLLIAGKEIASRASRAESLGAELMRGLSDQIGFVLVALLAAVVLLFVGTGLRSLGRWTSRQSLERQVERDGRPPILFLRAFRDDQAVLPQGRFLQRLLRAELGQRRLDHILVEEFARFGPVLALGRPGERMRPFGAARVYVEHSDWQAKVGDLAAKSAHIVLVVDEGAGVAWEIETMLAPALRAKTIFLATQPATDLRACEPLRHSLSDAVPAGPPVIGTFEGSDRAYVLCAARPLPETYIVVLQAFFRRSQLADVRSPAGLS